MNSVCLVTTCNRPQALERSLPQISALDRPVLVVDDGSLAWEKNAQIAEACDALYLLLPSNRGLACALNTGLSFWLADARVGAVSCFQDDVDAHPKLLEVLESFELKGFPLLTGHDAREHKPLLISRMAGYEVKHKAAIRATHMHARVEFWRSVYPIPTNKLGTPCCNGNGRGTGSNVDWWIVRDAPKSVQKIGKRILCIPHLIRTFCWKAEDSCWNNHQMGGEEPPLLEIKSGIQAHG